MGMMLDHVGRLIARYLEKPVQGYEPFTPSDPAALRATLRPGDVLLVEGNNHISGVIKYLTQSTWSHAALYLGDTLGPPPPGEEPRVLVDVSSRSQEITLFGKTHKMPVIVAPTGSTGLAWYEGEIALARAAASYGIPFTLAAGSMTALERLPETSRAVVWLHDVEGYTHEEIAGMMNKTPSFSKSQLSRAHARLRLWLGEEARA